MNTREKIVKVHELYLQNSDILVRDFFDVDSLKDLDFKIEVLTRLNNGENVSDKDFYRILELYPKGNINWD